MSFLDFLHYDNEIISYGSLINIFQLSVFCPVSLRRWIGKLCPINGYQATKEVYYSALLSSVVKNEKKKRGRPTERVRGLRRVTDVGYGLVSNCGG